MSDTERVRILTTVLRHSRNRDAQIAFLEHLKSKVVPGSPTRPFVESVVAHIGGRWSLSLIAMLGSGPYRFTALRQLLAPVSQRVLTLNLRALERDGFVLRTVRNEKPDWVEYELTAAGKELADKAWSLIDWIIEHAEGIAEARARFDKLR